MSYRAYLFNTGTLIRSNNTVYIKVKTARYKIRVTGSGAINHPYAAIRTDKAIPPDSVIKSGADGMEFHR